MTDEGLNNDGGREQTVMQVALGMSYLNFFFKIITFFVLWKVSYNYLLDIKQVYEAPRIIRVMKIVEMFNPDGQMDVASNPFGPGRSSVEYV